MSKQTNVRAIVDEIAVPVAVGAAPGSDGAVFQWVGSSLAVTLVNTSASAWVEFRTSDTQWQKMAPQDARRIQIDLATNMLSLRRAAYDGGAATVDIVVESLPVPVGPSLQRDIRLPVLMAAIGDSIAQSTDAGVHDMTKATTALTGKGIVGSRTAFGVPFVSGGRIRFVADCGISGQTTSELLARDALALSAGRRAINDAAGCGAQVGVLSIGVNDIILGNAVTASTTQSAIDTLLYGTLYPNIVAAMKRIYALGIWPIYRALPGFGPGSFATAQGISLADVDAKAAVIKAASEYIKNVLIPSLGFGALADIREACVDPVTGYWRPGMSNDGLHDGAGGVFTVSRIIAKAVLDYAGAPARHGPFALTGSKVVSQNAFLWPAFTTVTNGQVPGIAGNGNTGVGTNSIIKNVIEIDGVRQQVYDVSPLTFDAAGNATFAVNIDFSIYGPTPAVTVAAGELFAVELDLVVESATGGAPINVKSLIAKLAVRWNAGANIQEFYPIAGNSIAAYLHAATEPIDGKLVSIPMVMPESSANLTYCQLALTIFATGTAPYRVRLSNVRGVKLSTER